MLQVVNGMLMNTRDVGTAVAKLLMEGMAIDRISDIEGMPSPTQIAYLRRSNPEFAEAMAVAFEGVGIEAAFVLVKGAREGGNGRDSIGKNQGDAARWVAERMAPDLFQERKTVTTQEITLTDEELHMQLEAAARTDSRVKKLLDDMAVTVDMDPKKSPQQYQKRALQQLNRVRRRIHRSEAIPPTIEGETL